MYESIFLLCFSCVYENKWVISQDNFEFKYSLNNFTTMKFSLSNDSRELIMQSTGLNHDLQCSTAISGINDATKRCGAEGYQIKESKDVSPRGSIYLQMGRVLSLKKVKSYLRGI